MMGTEGNLGEMLGLGLAPTWASSMRLQLAGNYGEIFEDSPWCPNTPVGLARGLNASWTDGGTSLLTTI